MREILFRGKAKFENGSIKKGDWVYGDLVRLRDGNKTITHIYGYGEVLPETVGQFTGVYDKGGERIFEGDIIQYDAKKYIVKFGEGSFGTVYLDSKTVVAFSDYVNGVSYIDYEKGVETLYDVKVIGNLYDNLELLEVQ